jgi:hypothetical protein
MKIVNWNIEWMNDWFTPISAGPPAWRVDNPGRGITDVAVLAQRVAHVIRTLEPDVVTIQEGPSRQGEMQLFVDDFLDGDFQVLGPSGRGTQRLFTLVRKNGAVEHAARVWPESSRINFLEPWPVDIVGDLVVVGYEFTREPLEVELGPDDTLASLRTPTGPDTDNAPRETLVPWLEPASPVPSRSPARGAGTPGCGSTSAGPSHGEPSPTTS